MDQMETAELTSVFHRNTAIHAQDYKSGKMCSSLVLAQARSTSLS